MRVIGKREGLTSQGGRASRQREGPKPGPRSQQEHGVFWNSEPGIRGTSQTITDYTKGSAFILKMVTCSFILFVPSTHNIGWLGLILGSVIHLLSVLWWLHPFSLLTTPKVSSSDSAYAWLQNEGERKLASGLHLSGSGCQGHTFGKQVFSEFHQTVENQLSTKYIHVDSQMENQFINL